MLRTANSKNNKQSPNKLTLVQSASINQFHRFIPCGNANQNITKKILSKSKDLTSCTTKKEKTGNVLLSQAASHQVSSALRSLTTVFEMGTGVTSSLLSPDFLLVKFTYHCVATRSLRYSHTLVCSVPRNSCALCYANFPAQLLCF